MSAQLLLEKFKGKRIQFKDGPFHSSIGAFIPMKTHGIHLIGFHDVNKREERWVSLFYNETVDDNHWELAPPKKEY